MASVLAQVYERLPVEEQEWFRREAGLVVDAEPPECTETLNPLRSVPCDESRHWWKRPGIREAIPTTPSEALLKYYALGHQIRCAEKQVVWPLHDLSGQVLKDATALFPSKTAWKTWLKENVKTCSETTKFADYYLRLAEKVGGHMTFAPTYLPTDPQITELAQQVLAEQQPQQHRSSPASLA